MVICSYTLQTSKHTVGKSGFIVHIETHHILCLLSLFWIALKDQFTPHQQTQTNRVCCHWSVQFELAFTVVRCSLVHSKMFCYRLLSLVSQSTVSSRPINNHLSEPSPPHFSDICFTQKYIKRSIATSVTSLL